MSEKARKWDKNFALKQLTESNRMKSMFSYVESVIWERERDKKESAIKKGTTRQPIGLANVFDTF